MLLCRPAELLGTAWVLLAGLLVLFPPALEAAEPPQQRATAAVGSSVLLPGLDNVTHSDSVQWEFRSGSSSHTILQHHGGAHPPAIHAPYTGRATFHPSNGSLTLEDVQESDSGTYRVTVSTGDRKSREIQLEVLRSVSRPQLWTSALLARATGKIVCEVAEGRVDYITWKKDGQPLPPARVSRLSGSRSVLYLRPAQRSDCGSYSCNASNGISWQETSLNVTIEGLSRLLKDTLRIAVVAVVFAVVSAWGLIIPVCQSEKLRIRGELWRWLSSYTCGLVCIACILDGTAGILWMWEEGPSVAVILPEIALSYLTVVTFLVATTVIFQPTDFNHLKSKKAQRTMGYAAPGAVVTVVLTTTFLIKNIYHRHAEGCTEFLNVTILVVSTAAVSALPLLAIGLCYLSFTDHTTQGWRKDRDVCWTDKVSSFEMSQPGTKDPVPS
ncbi:hepatic and glial cell adhesion molecule-like isoform X2 [Aphelocoma coerulescens]|uniref:hepatic and glial cell adhesion molecule-like isoform X2 n=1 Tax=Aphelocoma coerulescens TaxID=39617 RepID=UPI0036047660